MNFWADPRLFNYVLIALNSGAALRWLWAGNWWAATYWGCAAGLNVVVTFGRTH